LSESAEQALAEAREEARRLGHDSIGAEHVLLALLQPGGAGEPMLRRLGLEPEQVRARLESGGRRGRPRRSGEELAHTSHARRLIEAASREAREAGVALSAEHLFLAALREPRGAMARILADAGIPPSDVRREAPDPVPAAGRSSPRPSPRGSASERPSSERPSSERPSSKRPLAEPPPTAGLPPHLRKSGTPRWRLVLLVAVPVSIVLGYVLHAPAVWIFITACLGVLPLAGYMGEATEHLAHRTGPTVGGLLNATFGNAAELIIALVALRAGLVDLVKASITGSILGNLLLIMGLALIAGGLNRSELRFNRTSAGMSSGMLTLAVVALAFPALYHAVHPEAAARASELYMSEAVSLILILTYGCSLLFTLRTHRRLLGGEAHPLDGPVWSSRKALLILAAATVGVAIESELLVHAATETTEALGLTPIFLGLIVIPIIGNAAEHAAAVVLSRKGQIDLGLQIALGSSTQIALLVAPVLVFAGVLMGQDMNLVFRPFEVLAVGMATVVTAIITLDGESHWFEGVQLLAVYLMVAVGAFFL
jgi:Ca2+:H+ antiporter